MKEDCLVAYLFDFFFQGFQSIIIGELLAAKRVLLYNVFQTEFCQRWQRQINLVYQLASLDSFMLK